MGWRAAAARSTVRTPPTVCLWTRVGTGLQMSATRPSLIRVRGAGGAVIKSTRSHGDPLLSTLLVSRGGGQVSREILEMEPLRVQCPALSGLICTRKCHRGQHIPNCSRMPWDYNPFRNPNTSAEDRRCCPREWVDLRANPHLRAPTSAGPLLEAPSSAEGLY